MSKLLKISLALVLTTNLITPPIPSEVSASAAQVSSSATQSSNSALFISSSTALSSSPVSSTKDTPKKKKKVKIVNNEIQEEDGIVLNKKDQERYDNCKKEVVAKRVKRYKNKPTPCFKTTSIDKPDNQTEATPEDYNILWASVAENKEIIETKVDPNVELPVSEFINLNEVEIVPNNSSSSLSSIVASSSTNSLSFPSSVVSSYSSLKASSYSSTQSYSLSYKASSSSQATSWLGNILNFGSVKVNAAANDGFRLPYENGARAKLTQTAFNNDIWAGGSHASHWDYSALDFFGEGQNYKIIASKPGKVVYSADTGRLGFGSHIVIAHTDGSYALYGHLNLRKVTLGDNILQAQYIGNEGSSGGQDFQHLHFETFSRYPCTVNNGVYNKVEACFEVTNGAWKDYKGNAFYLASALAPKFVECVNNAKCRNGYPDVAGEFYTSQNPPKPPILYPNMPTAVQPPQSAWWKAMDSGCTLDSVVVIKSRDNGDCQKLQYFGGDNSIRNPFDQCLDAGSNTKKLVFNTCNGSNNQRWKQENSTGKIWSFQREDGTNNARCIEYSGLNDNDEVYVLPCRADDKQKWYFEI